MTPPIVVPPAVANTVRTALGERERRQGVKGMTRTAALVAAELAASPITTPDVVRTVAAWHHANPTETTPDGRATVLAGVWGGRAGRDWALAMLAAAAPAPSPVAAGVAVVAADTGRVLMLQRSLDPEDPNGGKWEIPGGKLDEGEGALEAARREFCEETRIAVPGRLVGDWVTDDGIYHGFVHLVDVEADVELNVDHEDRVVENPDDPDGDGCEVIAWWSIDDAEDNPVLRDEVKASMPWDLLRSALPAKTAAISDPLPILGRKNLGEVSGKTDTTRHKSNRLSTTSRRLNRIDENLRRKLHAGAEVAMRSGLQRAGVKVAQRASKRSKALQAQVAACDQSYPPAVLAAVGITEQEALAHAFDAYAEQAESWFDEANRARVKVLATELDLKPDEQERAAKKWGTAKKVAVAALVAWLTALAFDRLTGTHPFEEPDGESPVSPLVPLSVISDAVAAADGRPTSVDTDGSTLVVERFGRGITFDVVSEQGIRLGIVTDQPVVEWITWHHGDPETPFDPHLKRDRKVSRADKIAETWAKSPEVFPYGTTYWFPHDHRACTCSWASEFVAEGEPAPVAAALEAQG